VIESPSGRSEKLGVAALVGLRTRQGVWASRSMLVPLASESAQT